MCVLCQFREKRLAAKLDTGSQANILSDELVKQNFASVAVKQSQVILLGFRQNKIQPIGKVALECQIKGEAKHYFDFEIVNFPCTPILGLSACIKLNLLKFLLLISTLMFLFVLVLNLECC